MIVNHIFEPARFSEEELTFMKAHITEPPHAAMHKGIPPGVNPIAIDNGLGEIYKLAELEKYDRQAIWCGHDAIVDSIDRYLDWQARCREIRRRGGPRHPSQFVWEVSPDGHYEKFKYAVGADAAEMVRTEILDDGTRRSFTVPLVQPEGGMFAKLDEVAPWLRAGQTAAQARPVDQVTNSTQGKHGTLTCSICGHADAYEVGKRSSYNLAVSRIAKHLKMAQTEINRHHRLYARGVKPKSATPAAPAPDAVT